ncbi:MAG TPA: ketoacyl-ACP synthase III [Verrucomicrobiales bacterium]|jgi:3-oxoacyl-[acyl-carrier-protein] synthase-3|nr:ketoacyl-ACP synthase III [Verrucomicrobiales bacterium]
MNATIAGIEYHLPEKVLTSAGLAAEFPGWSVEKIQSKTGIEERRIAGDEEFASDLAVQAAEKLFAGGIARDSIDALLYCTQSPDYFLPTTACLLQDRLGLPTTIAALDFNLGCSGYIYGLGLARGLIQSGQAKRVLFLTAETYSKFIHPGDRSVRTLFGDAAAATLVEARESAGLDGPFVYGTDGSGAQNLIVPAGGIRKPQAQNAEVITDDAGNQRTENHLYMNGPEIFNFTLRIVPATVESLLTKSGLALADIDLFVFHQANQYMLEHLRKRLGVPAEKFLVSMQKCGNTVSSTIPIALRMAQDAGQLQDGMKIMLLGFGVGYSWGGTVMTWKAGE